jgi:hypothetical protein
MAFVESGPYTLKSAFRHKTPFQEEGRLRWVFAHKLTEHYVVYQCFPNINAFDPQSVRLAHAESILQR